MPLRPGLDPHIVIIGCGISGIGAAQRLIKHGFRNVRIVEATARSGGRIRTGRLGDNVVEIGANWIHGPSKENPVFRLACQYHLLDQEAMSEENQALECGGHLPFIPNWFSSSGRKLGMEMMGPAMELFSSLLDKSQEFYTQGGEPVASVGEFIKAQGRRLAQEQWGEDPGVRDLRLALLSTMLKSECCVNGTHSMDAVGLGAFGMYQTLPGLDCTFPGGYGGLIDRLIGELPKGTVSYSKPVRRVRWTARQPGSAPEAGARPVTVECEDGETIPADHVIVTVSLGYLKRHVDTLLDPPLPLHKLHSIQRMGFGTNNKIFLEFEQPFWEEDCEVILLVWEDEGRLTDVVEDLKTSWIQKLFGFTVLKPKEKYGHVLCGWIAGHESEHMESLSELEILNTVTQVLRRFTGNPTVTPRKLLRSQWFHEPYTCGSYTYAACGCSAQDLENLAEPLPAKDSQAKPLQVLFAGEATHPSFFSTVHGALQTGWREAERLVSLYAPPSSDPVTSRL